MKTHEILFQTLSQADDYVNGEQLAKELGVSFEEMKRGLKNIEATSMRLELIKKDGFSILNDCYNSSPVAVKSAIDVMKNMKEREE